MRWGFEPLEDRRLLAVFNVNTTADRTIDTGLTTLATPYGNGGKLTLREAIYLANLDNTAQSAPVDTVVLKANSTYKITVAGANEDDDMTGDFDITRNLIITKSGSGANPLVNGNGLDRVFDIVTDGIQLTLDHLTITGGITRTIGGAVNGVDDETLTISNSTIKNNIATSPGAGFGGGIALTSGDLTIVNSSITGNTAAAGINGYGGGIRIDSGSGDITIRNSTISGNSAYGGGGAMVDGSSGALTVVNSQIFNNHAGTDNGGAFYLTDASSVTITNCVFSGNDSASNGGAIYFDSAEAINITGSQFLRNTSNSDGGAIWTDDGTVNVKSSTFANNTSTTGNGGAIGNAGPLDITGSTFTHNVAGAYGGAIQNNNAGITILRSVFTKNAAFQNGGAIEADGSTSDNDITGSRFSYNRANANGGAIEDRYNDLFLTNCTLDHNTSVTGNGGAVDMGDTETHCFFTNTTFTNNISKGDGGGFNAGESIIDLENCTLSFNIATNGEGGGFSDGQLPNNGGEPTTINNSTINGNRSGGNGAGFAVGGETLSMSGTRVSANRSGSDGGGIYIATTGTNSNPYPGNLGVGSLIINCTISSNGSFDAGGGIDFEGDGDLTIINDTMVFNASTSGGGIAQTDGTGTIHIGNTIVAKNTATNGPDIYDAQNAFDDLGHNLFFSLLGQGTAGIQDGAPILNSSNDIIGKAPLLGALAFNGGPTETYALLAGSPAINAADNTLAPSTDQRGVHRPQGPHADIGAFEKS